LTSSGRSRDKCGTNLGDGCRCAARVRVLRSALRASLARVTPEAVRFFDSRSAECAQRLWVEADRWPKQCARLRRACRGELGRCHRPADRCTLRTIRQIPFGYGGGRTNEDSISLKPVGTDLGEGTGGTPRR
jgi:hypothetical protein